MSKDTLAIVCDANVWLDAFIPSRTHSAAARDFLVRASALGHNILYPGHVIAEVFYQVRLEAKQWVRGSESLTENWALAARSHAWSCVKDMHEIATAVGTDEPDVWLAVKYRALNGDFEDNLVLAAARRAHADYLVTSDRQLQRKAPIAALSPADMLAVLNIAAEV